MVILMWLLIIVATCSVLISYLALLEARRARREQFRDRELVEKWNRFFVGQLSLGDVVELEAPLPALPQAVTIS